MLNNQITDGPLAPITSQITICRTKTLHLRDIFPSSLKIAIRGGYGSLAGLFLRVGKR